MDTLFAIVLVLVAATVLLLVVGGLGVWVITIWCRFIALLVEVFTTPASK